jgi:hypothetical protein
MGNRDKDLTIHEVKDKPRILVDIDSPASFLVNPKFINRQVSYKITGSSLFSSDAEPDEGDQFGDPDEENGAFKAPEYTDIYIKYNGTYENMNPTHTYGVLYNQPDVRVELDFKIMIPLDIADDVIGVEILSGNEVIAAI